AVGRRDPYSVSPSGRTGAAALPDVMSTARSLITFTDVRRTSLSVRIWERTPTGSVMRTSTRGTVSSTADSTPTALTTPVSRPSSHTGDPTTRPGAPGTTAWIAYSVRSAPIRSSRKKISVATPTSAARMSVPSSTRRLWRGACRTLFSPAMIRLGHIDYSNCVPVHALLLECGAPDVAIVRDIPSRLNAALAAGEIDVAPCSSIEYARHPDEYSILSRHAIGSAGPVQSILLESTVPLHELHGRTVAVPTASATSTVLLRILLELRTGIHAQYEDYAQGDDV